MADAARGERELESTYTPSSGARSFSDTGTWTVAALSVTGATTVGGQLTETTTTAAPTSIDSRCFEYSWNGTTNSSLAKILTYIDPAHAASIFYVTTRVIAFNGTMDRYWNGQEANIFQVTANGTPTMNGTDTNMWLNGTNGTFTLAYGVNGTTGRINIICTGPASLACKWKGVTSYLRGTTSN